MISSLMRAPLSVCLAFVFGLPVFAQDGADAPAADAAPEAKAEETAAGRAVRNIALAQQLVEYGVTEKSPAALLAAAEILHDNPTSGKPAPGVSVEGGEPPKEDGRNDAAGVLAAAEEMAKSEGMTDLDGAILRLKKKLAEKPRGGYPHPHSFEGHIHGGQTVTYRHVHFHGHNHAEVHPEHYHGGRIDLDLIVLNRWGHQVAADTSPSSRASVHWDGDGDYTILVKFYGDHADYHLTTN
ncbi:hypothetical protein [Alienimonas sp. DA493]|uniref:hypothetical protein n=1 Tax=Alienimonas sp. DA493 TaxID=3373605 RepID=UPI003754DB9A